MDGAAALGSATVSRGAATLKHVVLHTGSHQITASYSDASGSYAPSSTTPQATSLITTIAGGSVGGGGRQVPRI